MVAQDHESTDHTGTDGNAVPATAAFKEQPGMERRLVLRLLKYWRSKAADRPHAALRDIKAEDIPDMWPFCFVLELGAWRQDPLILKCGDAFTHPPAAMLLQSHVSSLPARTLITHALGFLAEAVAKEVPITRGGTFNTKEEKEVRFRSILLPLSDDGKTVSHLLGAANCKEIAEAGDGFLP